MRQVTLITGELFVNQLWKRVTLTTDVAQEHTYHRDEEEEKCVRKRVTLTTVTVAQESSTRTTEMKKRKNETGLSCSCASFLDALPTLEPHLERTLRHLRCLLKAEIAEFSLPLVLT